jgi:hypothetical protein
MVWCRLASIFALNQCEPVIIGDLRPESTLRQTDFLFRHALAEVDLSILSGNPPLVNIISVARIMLVVQRILDYEMFRRLL